MKNQLKIEFCIYFRLLKRWYPVRVAHYDCQLLALVATMPFYLEVVLVTYTLVGYVNWYADDGTMHSTHYARQPLSDDGLDSAVSLNSPNDSIR